ncbi:hypothetical protein SYK_11900 [Pseudodesulfovibrio nedwellii]|uniref:Chemotaxis protein n=2 Tax=Pseudodesulfovibrio nedwellii TaxID=2973072 RepID=A0ABN6S3A2_9BACT|nr:hypothetical protein SYK_11900 [Pseudodesulfovibrio nedwellii]
MADTIDVMPGLHQKIVLDVVNSINVAQDVERVQSNRSRIRHRLMDSITGAGGRRQNAINENHTEAIRGLFDFAVELTKSIELTNSVTTQINKQLVEVHKNIKDLALGVCEINDRLEQFIGWSEQRIGQLEERLKETSIEHSAHTHLERAFAKWAAGRLNQYSPITQLYLVIDDLYWGDFGELCKRYPDSQACKNNIGHAQDKLLIQLHTIMETESQIELPKWVTGSHNIPPKEQQSLSYMGDWATKHLHFPRTATNISGSPTVGVPLQFDCAFAVTRMWKQSMEIRLNDKIN